LYCGSKLLKILLTTFLEIKQTLAASLFEQNAEHHSLELAMKRLELHNLAVHH
jgi:hypothetical protein